MTTYIYKAYSLNQLVNWLMNRQYQGDEQFKLVAIGRSHNNGNYLVTYEAYQEWY